MAKLTIFILKNPIVSCPVCQRILSKHSDGFLRHIVINFISRVWHPGVLDWGCIILISHMLWRKVGFAPPGPNLESHASAEKCEKLYLESDPWRLQYAEYQVILKRCSCPEHIYDGWGISFVGHIAHNLTTSILKYIKLIWVWKHILHGVMWLCEASNM